MLFTSYRKQNWENTAWNDLSDNHIYDNSLAELKSLIKTDSRSDDVQQNGFNNDIYSFGDDLVSGFDGDYSDEDDDGDLPINFSNFLTSDIGDAISTSPSDHQNIVSSSTSSPQCSSPISSPSSSCVSSPVSTPSSQYYNNDFLSWEDDLFGSTLVEAALPSTDEDEDTCSATQPKIISKDQDRKSTSSSSSSVSSSHKIKVDYDYNDEVLNNNRVSDIGISESEDFLHRSPISTVYLPFQQSSFNAFKNTSSKKSVALQSKKLASVKAPRSRGGRNISSKQNNTSSTTTKKTTKKNQSAKSISKSSQAKSTTQGKRTPSRRGRKRKNSSSSSTQTDLVSSTTQTPTKKQRKKRNSNKKTNNNNNSTVASSNLTNSSNTGFSSSSSSSSNITPSKIETLFTNLERYVERNKFSKQTSIVVAVDRSALANSDQSSPISLARPLPKLVEGKIGLVSSATHSLSDETIRTIFKSETVMTLNSKEEDEQDEDEEIDIL